MAARPGHMWQRYRRWHKTNTVRKDVCRWVRRLMPGSNTSLLLLFYGKSQHFENHLWRKYPGGLSLAMTSVEHQSTKDSEKGCFLQGSVGPMLVQIAPPPPTHTLFSLNPAKGLQEYPATKCPSFSHKPRWLKNIPNEALYLHWGYDFEGLLPERG
jgi:hypothetical protein